jgi:hypothetical protein
VTDSPSPRRQQGPDLVRSWLVEARSLDQAIYETIAVTPTPSLDRVMRTLSTAANYSRLWMGTAAAIAVLGGRPGREAAAQGLISVAVTSAVVNIALKRVGRRPTSRAGRRPLSRTRRADADLAFVPLRARCLGVRICDRIRPPAAGRGGARARSRRAGRLLKGAHRRALPR